MCSVAHFWAQASTLNETKRRGNSLGFLQVNCPGHSSMSWGPTGPLIIFPLWTRPLVVSIGFLGYYGALCDEPFYYAYYY